MVDLGTQFCERCGRDRDSFASARNTYRDCPACGAACCADCWNLVDGACLACAPFRLVESTTRPRIVVSPQAVAERPATSDPYADLRGSAPPLDAWDATWGAAHQRPKETPPAGIARPASVPTKLAPAPGDSVPSPARRGSRRAGRVGMAAGGAWVVVAMLAVVALGATPGARVPAPTEDTPRLVPSPAATTAPNPPAATPVATRAPRATPRPTPRARLADPGVTAPRTTPRPTKPPVKPIVVPPPPPPTPESIPDVPPASAPEPSPAISGASPATTVP
jgi:hypothetical protein